MNEGATTRRRRSSAQTTELAQGGQRGWKAWREERRCPIAGSRPRPSAGALRGLGGAEISERRCTRPRGAHPTAPSLHGLEMPSGTEAFLAGRDAEHYSATARQTASTASSPRHRRRPGQRRDDDRTATWLLHESRHCGLRESRPRSGSSSRQRRRRNLPLPAGRRRSTVEFEACLVHPAGRRRKGGELATSPSRPLARRVAWRTSAGTGLIELGGPRHQRRGAPRAHPQRSDALPDNRRWPASRPGPVPAGPKQNSRFEKTRVRQSPRVDRHQLSPYSNRIAFSCRAIDERKPPPEGPSWVGKNAEPTQRRRIRGPQRGEPQALIGGEPSSTRSRRSSAETPLRAIRRIIGAEASFANGEVWPVSVDRNRPDPQPGRTSWAAQPWELTSGSRNAAAARGFPPQRTVSTSICPDELL